MNLFRLSFAYLRAQPLTAGLNVVLLALGVATITVLLLVGRQLEDGLSRDARGIDLVLGAKGSPIQIILSSVYHLDVPTGNIPLASALRWEAHPLIAEAIPLALGDSYAGFRIVGTTHAYPQHFGAELARGRLWSRSMEAVLGATVAAERELFPGRQFIGVHGLEGGTHAHDYAPYTVVGVLEPTGGVLDRLILTSVESVWDIHEMDHDHDHDHGHDEGHAHPDEHDEATDANADRQITAMLLRFRSPLAAVTLPRLINSGPDLTAAAPAYETARLLGFVGIGLATVRGFGVLLIVTAGLGLFIALYTALKTRQWDLAVMRSLGASRAQVMSHVLLEGLILAAAGALLGLLLGHTIAELLGQTLRQAGEMGITGRVFYTEEVALFALMLVVGVLAALLPAWAAYRTDIARTLARTR